MIIISITSYRKIPITVIIRIYIANIAVVLENVTSKAFIYLSTSSASGGYHKYINQQFYI